MSEARTAREAWGTRFGFLMAMLGAMVGVGNIWRMPYTAGENGGGAFLIAYFLLLFVIAVPGLMAETVLGSYTRRGTIGSFRRVYGRGALEGLGLVVALVNLAVMSYYAPIIGWTVYYAFHAVIQTFFQPGFEGQAFWNAFSGSATLNVAMHTLTMVAIGALLLLGIQRGIERAVKWMVPLLVIALIAIAFSGLTLDGAMAGLEFAFTPDWDYLVRGQTWIAALGQALFSTGLGWGIALTYGSYLRRYDDVPLGGGVFTAVGNTSVGLLAIFAVLPVVFAFGLSPAQGPELSFVSLVNVFPQMTAGAIWAIIFFVGFFFAAFTSGLAITEVGVTATGEEIGTSRKQSVIIVCALIWLLGLPSALSAGFLDGMDFMFANWGLPLATLIIIGTAGWKIRPERMRVLLLNRNSDLYIGRYWDGIVKFAIPAVMIFIMAYYVVTEYADAPGRTLGGVALIAGLTLASLAVAGWLRRGHHSAPTHGEE